MKKMNSSSKPKFDNTLLKRWLLTVGPIRRKSLLKKFKNNLIRLGIPNEGVRKGLLQLSSRPSVDVFKNTLNQITRDKSTDNSEDEINARPTANFSKDNERLKNIVANNKLKDKNNNEEFSKLDLGINGKSTASDIDLKVDQRLSAKNKSRKTGSSQKSKNKSRSRKRRRLDVGENPNGITWRLIEIDMGNNKFLLKRFEEEKRRKKQRLLAKFKEIFGDVDEDEFSEGEFDPRTRFEASGVDSEELESEGNRKSPTFSSKGKKRKRTNSHMSQDNNKKLKVIEHEPLQNIRSSISTENTQNTTESDTSLDDASTQCGSDTPISNRNAILEKQLRELGLMSESENESADRVYASIASTETLPITRQQSVIFKLDKHGESVPVIPENMEPTAIPSPVLELERVASENVDESALVARSPDICKANSIEKTETPNIPDIVDDDSTETIITSQNMNLEKEEPAFQQFFNNGSISSSRNSFDFDPIPSSTTGTEQSGIDRSESYGINDRLLGALDNIFLALRDIRRFKEQQQAITKLAIEQNRSQEKRKICQAKREFDEKLDLFKREVFYLTNSIETWEGVLGFIAQGLDNRTPASMKPFTKVEIEAAMKEADSKVPSDFIREKSLVIPKELSVGTVFCIDLTHENDDKDVEVLCDSSTDPPKSGHKAKYEVVNIDDECNFDLREIHRQLPSITEVKTISPQQFETIAEYPCLLCSRISQVACSQCTKATYCSKRCQELHWIQAHHANCIPLKGVIRCSK